MEAVLVERIPAPQHHGVQPLIHNPQITVGQTLETPGQPAGVCLFIEGKGVFLPLRGAMAFAAEILRQVEKIESEGRTRN